MKDNKYFYQPYNDNFRQLYREEELKLRNILGNNIIIEHCGSTAIPGLGGQGIIDILLGSKESLISEISQKLQAADYNYKPYNSDKDSLFFSYDYPGIISRKVHLYLTENNKEDYFSKIAFRNFLLKYNKIATEYNELKKRVINLKEEEKEIYQEARKDFINRITKEAIKEYG